jgi:hypothetical protein
VKPLALAALALVAGSPLKVVREFPGGPSPIVVLPVGGHVLVSHTTATSLWRF